MAQHFNLSIADYVALGTLLVLTAGSGIAVTQANVNATEARVMGEAKVLSERVDGRFDLLGIEWQSFADEIRSLVEQGLEYRTDEAALALARIAELNSSLVVEFTNFQKYGKLYESISSFPGDSATSVKLSTVGDKAVGQITFASFGALDSSRIGQMVEDLGQEEAESVQVRVLLPEFHADTNASEIKIQILKRQIEALQKELSAVE